VALGAHHALDVFEEHGFEQTLVSPQGGAVPLEPRALKFPNYDKTAKAWRADPAKMALLESTLSPEQVDSAAYDAIYFTGGPAVRKRGDLYEKAKLPFVSYAVVDGNLVTGQNPRVGRPRRCAPSTTSARGPAR
jgi:putative intracellular protease/amidase